MSAEAANPKTVASMGGTHPQEISDRKRRANRENAKKSTGPKSDIGKFNSSFNAIKHGLLSRRIVIKTDEEADRLNQLIGDLYERYGSDGDVRTELLIEFALVDYWRHARSLDAEEPLFSPAFSTLSISSPQFSANLFRYMASNRRALLHTLNILEEARDKRIRESQSVEELSTPRIPARGERRASPSKSSKGSYRRKRGSRPNPEASASPDLAHGENAA